MVIVKMKIHGMYGGKTFKIGDQVQFTEDEIKGLDSHDYEVIDTVVSKEENNQEEKQVEKSSDKMQRSRSKK